MLRSKIKPRTHICHAMAMALTTKLPCKQDSYLTCLSMHFKEKKNDTVDTLCIVQILIHIFVLHISCSKWSPNYKKTDIRLQTIIKPNSGQRLYIFLMLSTLPDLCMLARVAMLMRVSGCSVPSSFFLKFNT